MTFIDPLLKAREVADFLQVSLPTLYRRVADGTLPKPLKLGSLSRWPRSEISAAVERAKTDRVGADETRLSRSSHTNDVRAAGKAFLTKPEAAA